MSRPSKLRFFFLLVTPALLAITMPQCPGQAELSTRVDQLQSSVDSLSKRLGESENQVRNLTAEMGQAKSVMAQVANALQEQTSLIKDLTTKVDGVIAAASKKGKPALQSRGAPRSQ